MLPQSYPFIKPLSLSLCARVAAVCLNVIVNGRGSYSRRISTIRGGLSAIARLSRRNTYRFVFFVCLQVAPAFESVMVDLDQMQALHHALDLPPRPAEQVAASTVSACHHDTHHSLSSNFVLLHAFRRNQYKLQSPSVVPGRQVASSACHAR